jgi:hypothetical protein
MQRADVPGQAVVGHQGLQVGVVGEQVVWLGLQPRGQ